MVVYGRLDVFWPDGKIETFSLAQATVSVGRSSGNTITLDTDTISRYHISLTHEDGVTYLTDLDSVNGTYLDGVKLTSNQAYPLSGGEEIQIGHLRLSYHTLDDAPTVPLSITVEDTQRIEHEEKAFRVDLQLSSISVTPGAYTSVELLITNTSDQTATYTVEVLGVPPEWARITRPLLEIPGNDDALVIINIKPQRRSDAVPGTYNAVVRVRSQEHPDAVLDVPLKVHLQAFAGFGMALAGSTIETGRQLHLHMHNQGSAPLSIEVAALSREGRHVFRIAPDRLLLAPGQRVRVAVTVNPAQKRWIGREARQRVDLTVRSTALPYFTAAIPAYVIDKPPVGVRGAVGIGAGAIALIALVFIALIGTLTRQPEPTIERFVVNGNRDALAQGLPLNVAWSVRDAREVELTINGQAQELPQPAAPQGELTLSTNALSGQLVITLVARNGERDASQAHTVVIYEPAVIEALEITPATLWRDVVQTVTVSWVARGVQAARLDGLEGLVGVGYQPPPLVGNSLEITALPEDDFTITLTVVDYAGSEAAVSLSVVLRTPTCQTRDDATAFHAQPSTEARVVRVVNQADAEIPIKGIDSTGTWLSARLPDGQDGWTPLDGLVCSGFNVADLRVIAVAPPTPTIRPPLATVTPTPAPAILPALTPTPTG